MAAALTSVLAVILTFPKRWALILDYLITLDILLEFSHTFCKTAVIITDIFVADAEKCFKKQTHTMDGIKWSETNLWGQTGPMTPSNSRLSCLFLVVCVDCGGSWCMNPYFLEYLWSSVVRGMASVRTSVRFVLSSSL